MWIASSNKASLLNLRPKSNSEALYVHFNRTLEADHTQKRRHTVYGSARL